MDKYNQPKQSNLWMSKKLEMSGRKIEPAIKSLDDQKLAKTHAIHKMSYTHKI